MFHIYVYSAASVGKQDVPDIRPSV